MAASTVDAIPGPTAAEPDAGKTIELDLKKQMNTIMIDMRNALNDFLKNVRQGKIGAPELRFFDTVLYGFCGLTGLLMPGLWTLFLGGGWGNHTVESDWVRLFALHHLIIAFIIQLSSNWGAQAKRDMIKIMGLLHAAQGILLFLLVLYGNMRYLNLINVLVLGGAAMLHMKEAKVFK